MILEQVSRLTDRIACKVDSSKDDTLNLAKKVNQIQYQIKNTTRKMMANVSELSIAQANALKLQEEVKSKHLLLEKYTNRMDKVKYLRIFKIEFFCQIFYPKIFKFRVKHLVRKLKTNGTSTLKLKKRSNLNPNNYW